ncbi:MAG: hypothetical protein V3575_05215, partial [Candidatus Absconditabacteria bacterium]
MIEQVKNNDLEEIKLGTQKELSDLKNEILQTKDKLDKVNEYLSNNTLGKQLLTNTLNDLINNELVGFYLDKNNKICFDENADKELLETIIKIANKIGVKDEIYIDIDGDKEIGTQDIIISQKQQLDNINPLTSSTGQLLEKEKNNPGFLKENFLEPINDKKFKVNFKSNKNAEKDIGISDMLEKNIKTVKITDTEGKSNVYDRQGLHGSFFDKDNNYGDVLNEYEIEIIEEFNQEEIISIETGIESKIKQELEIPKIK